MNSIKEKITHIKMCYFFLYTFHYYVTINMTKTLHQQH